MSPTSSQLSSHGSSEFGDDIKTDDEHDQDQDPDRMHLSTTKPPTKKRRIASSRTGPLTPLAAAMTDATAAVADDHEYISDDTDGSIPNSPSAEQMQDEDPRQQLQVRACRWDGCPAGDLENMDNLVVHLHEEHIGSKETNYSCEWMECPRKSQSHASAYALKAHTRSHTKEKPSYCSVPECERSFTRSDALAKHMRTVHEMDALHLSATTIQSTNTNPYSTKPNFVPAKPQRLKLIMNTKNPAAEPRPCPEPVLRHSPPRHPSTYPLHLTASELSAPPDKLYHSLQHTLLVATATQTKLEAEVHKLERDRRDEWAKKELVLLNLMEAELAVAHAHSTLREEEGEDEETTMADRARIMQFVKEDLPAQPLPMDIHDESIGMPWWRAVEGDPDTDRVPEPEQGLSHANTLPLPQPLLDAPSQAGHGEAKISGATEELGERREEETVVPIMASAPAMTGWSV